MTTIRLIADDLTGALDAAAQFAAGTPGFPVRLSEGATPSRAMGLNATSCESGAISTYSRDLNAAAGKDAIAKAAPFLAGADIAFVKIDSLLRGNWATDLVALLAAYPGRSCIFAPAFPAQGRVTVGGRQFAPGPDGVPFLLPIAPAEKLAALGLTTSLVSSGAISLVEPGGVLICDAAEQADLDILARTTRAMNRPVLWCGSAGLARALAGQEPPKIMPDAASPLIVVGSFHPVTLEQIDAVPGDLAARVLLGPDSVAAAKRIERTINVTSCIATIDLPPGLSPSEAIPTIVSRLAATLPRISSPRLLLVIGGETLAAVCRAVHAEALAIEGEFQPGVPCSRIVGGMWDGARLISRSGAFGRPFFLRDILSGSSRAPA